MCLLKRHPGSFLLHPLVALCALCFLASPLRAQGSARKGEPATVRQRGSEERGGKLSGDSQGILSRAREALEKGDQQGALNVLAKLRGEDGAAHFAAGEMLAEKKAYAAAAREFGLARRSYHDRYMAGYDQALAFLNAGEYSSALETANDLLNQGHQTAELADLAGTAYLKSGQKREAYNAFRLATRLNPQDEPAYVGLCQITLENDQYDLGLEVANVGIVHLPASEQLHILRGVMYAMKGLSSEAEGDFSTAAKLAPTDPLPVVSAALIQMQGGKLEAAVAMLRQAAHEHPQNFFAQYWFAIALSHAGAVPGTPEGDEVLSALEKSVSDNPNFWHSRAELGKNLLARDQVDQAIEQLEKANQLNPKATSPLYLLAQCYRRKGNMAKATELAAKVGTMQEQEREAQTIPNVTLKQLVTEEAAGTASQDSKH